MKTLLFMLLNGCFIYAVQPAQMQRSPRIVNLKACYLTMQAAEEIDIKPAYIGRLILNDTAYFNRLVSNRRKAKPKSLLFALLFK